MLRLYFCFLLVFFSQAGHAQKLTIKNLTLSKAYTPKELLNHTNSKVLNLPLLNYPGQKISFKGVPVGDLLNLSTKDTVGGTLAVKFVCLDGFSGLIDLSYLTNRGAKEARAYIAVEDPKKPWPKLPKSSTNASAGPYYLVWENPEKSSIPPEYWPYQLSALEIVKVDGELFPKMMPGKKASNQVRSGLAVFQKRCMACHKLNGQGTSNMGPDLNLPMNPVEYFTKAALQKFLKDPQSVRSWPGMKMVWVKNQGPSDQEVSDVIAYLEHMAKRKSK